MKCPRCQHENRPVTRRPRSRGGAQDTGPQARAGAEAPHRGHEDVPEMGMTHWLTQAEAPLR